MMHMMVSAGDQWALVGGKDCCCQGLRDDLKAARLSTLQPRVAWQFLLESTSASTAAARLSGICVLSWTLILLEIWASLVFFSNNVGAQVGVACTFFSNHIFSC